VLRHGLEESGDDCLQLGAVESGSFMGLSFPLLMSFQSLDEKEMKKLEAQNITPVIVPDGDPRRIPTTTPSRLTSIPTVDPRKA
jgi:hypothetical protein